MYSSVKWEKFTEEARNRNIQKRLKIKRPREKNSIQGRESSRATVRGATREQLAL